MARWLLLVCLLFALIQVGRAERLQVGDVLTVSVVNAEEFSGDFPILRTGVISGRGFGEVPAVGRSLAQVEQDVKKALGKVLKSPQVQVTIKSLRQAFVYLIGVKTATPGPIDWVSGLTMRKLLSAAEPPGEPIEEFQVNRYRGTEILELDYRGILSGDIQDMPLEPDDVIAIVRKPSIRIWVMGLVKNPGEVRLATQTDLYQAIAKAGGVLWPTDPSAQGLADEDLKIVVRRGPESLEFPVQSASSQARILLQPGDLVSVVSAPRVRVAVLGLVQKPGEFVVRSNSGALGAIAQAEGVSPEGSLKQVVIVRGRESFMVDLSQPLVGQSPSWNGLQDGDTIYVRRNEDVVLVLGNVQKPGRFGIQPGQTMRMADALALAGGLDSKGSLRRVHLARPGADGRIQVESYNLDEFLKSGRLASNPVLRPGDVLLFGEPKGVTLSNLSQFLTSALLVESLFRR